MKRLICLCLILLSPVFVLTQTVQAGAPGDGHLYEYVEAKSKAATCTESGYSYYECKNHKDVFYTEPIEPLGHDLDAGTLSPADCTHPETLTRYCSRCDYVEVSEIGPALGHSYTSVVSREASRTKEGVRTFTCERCGDTYTESIPKLTGTHKNSAGEKATEEVNELITPEIDPAVELPSDTTENATTKDNKSSNHNEKTDAPQKVIEKVNGMLIVVIILEISVFTALLYKDVKVLIWYASRKKAALIKNDTRGRGL